MVPRSEAAARARALRQHLPGHAARLAGNGDRARPRHRRARLSQEPAQRCPAGRQDGRLPAAARRICRSCGGSTAAALPGRERAWLDTVLWLGDRMTEAARDPLWRHRRLHLSDPLCDLAADRLLPGASPTSSTASTRSRPAPTPRPMSPGSRRSRATSTSRSTRPAPTPAAASSRPASSSTRR